MDPHDLDIRLAVENNTCLILVTGRHDNYRAALYSRYHQLIGMIELARRVPLSQELITFLEDQRDYLHRCLQAEQAG